MNGFLQLKDEEINAFVQVRQDTVRNTVESRLGTYHFIGDVVELFFPKVADTITVLAGGDVINPDSEYLTIEEGGSIEDNLNDRRLPSGPGDQDEIIR
ncbi:hypothetical protein [Neolewinella agarilytica]|uniref:Uncharacterized protein n=1 Tax=Neolewinella agarilytica TaxID=478744 RepID=A0A1H9IKE0_9BACT|nr:hypothetical protein [Neolewinella agarilytica]SEQ75026.1 hypothetical protein SAMN05444359_11537 [Neolewinella agarilytica]